MKIEEIVKFVKHMYDELIDWGVSYVLAVFVFGIFSTKINMPEGLLGGVVIVVVWLPFWVGYFHNKPIKKWLNDVS